MTKPVVVDSLPVCVSQANPGDQQGAKQVNSNQKKISPSESINFGGVQIRCYPEKNPSNFSLFTRTRRNSFFDGSVGKKFRLFK